MPGTLFRKYERLKHSIRRHRRVGVAFSGGVDSSLLLHAAGESLGKENVLALHGRSQLNFEMTSALETYEECFSGMAQLEVIDLDPLSWPDFVNNDSQRCYHCKKKTYARFLAFLREREIEVLLDGTNVDDQEEERPGRRALDEFDVKTPLVEVGLRKREIRFLAKSFDLPNHDSPSNSCLATRLRFLPNITPEGLKKVQEIEKHLERMGFFGCRARPAESHLIVEVRQQDIHNISKVHNRLKVVELGRENGFDAVLLNLRGR